MATRRFLSLWLPRLATDRARRLNGVDKRAPLAAVAKVDNAERLVCVDAEAARLGLTPACRSPTRARVIRTSSRSRLSRRKRRGSSNASATGARASPRSPRSTARDGLMLDISGVAHLFGGEAALIEDCRARLAAQGFAVAAGVGGNPRAAWALARFSPTKIAPEPLSDKAFAKLFHDLPLAALGLEEKTVADMARAGLRRIGDIALRPRAPIAARFGPRHGPARRAQGLERASIAPRFAAGFSAERRFASPVETIEAIEATLCKLADDLVVMLERQAKGARRIELSSIASMATCAHPRRRSGCSTRRARSCGSSPSGWRARTKRPSTPATASTSCASPALRPSRSRPLRPSSSARTRPSAPARSPSFSTG